MIRKLKNKAGESISEVLVALLVSVLGVMMLAAVITSATRTVKTTGDKTNEYVAAENALVQQGSSGSTGTVTLKNGSGTAVAIADPSKKNVNVYYYDLHDIYEGASAGKVVAYKAR